MADAGRVVFAPTCKEGRVEDSKQSKGKWGNTERAARSQELLHLQLLSILNSRTSCMNHTVYCIARFSFLTSEEEAV